VPLVVVQQAGRRLWQGSADVPEVDPAFLSLTCGHGYVEVDVSSDDRSQVGHDERYCVRTAYMRSLIARSGEDMDMVFTLGEGAPMVKHRHTNITYVSHHLLSVGWTGQDALSALT
jgi:hypothetical protein